MSFPPLAFVDLETTGATATADRITEIGIVEVDADGVREWSSLVDPGMPIPPFIESLTGISNAMVAGAPSFAQLADEVFERLRGRLFVAHNARFDYGFLKNEFRRTGHDFRASVLCTVKLSRRLYPQHARHNLDSLIARHGLDAGDRHRALADARVIHQFWTRLCAEVEPEVLAAAVKAQTAGASLPSHIDPETIAALPEGPGVYLFYGENELPLYVGKSKEVRRRVLSHFAGDHAAQREMVLASQVRRIEAIATGGEVGALLMESALVKRLQPIHNRALRRNREICFWQLVEAAPGDWRPRLRPAADLGDEWPAQLYGPFKGPREAKQVLADVAAERELCPARLGLEAEKPGKPCFARQIHKCRGVCVGAEAAIAHSARLMAALAPWRAAAWPFSGPAWLREEDEVHLVDRWRHVGTARSEDELQEILGAPLPEFDRDTYRILVNVADRLMALAAPR